MKILRLLNNISLSIILILFVCLNSYAEDKPVDIWNIEKEETNGISKTQSLEEENNQIKSTSEIDIYKMQTQKKNDSIKLDDNLKTEKIKIIGLYDPEDFDLDINM